MAINIETIEININIKNTKLEIDINLHDVPWCDPHGPQSPPYGINLNEAGIIFSSFLNDIFEYDEEKEVYRSQYKGFEYYDALAIRLRKEHDMCLSTIIDHEDTMVEVDGAIIEE